MAANCQNFNCLKTLIYYKKELIYAIAIFQATDEVKSNKKWLAVVESTQSGEVIFTLLGGILFLGDALPDLLGALGTHVDYSGYDPEQPVLVRQAGV